jgi:hypothetical protein
MGPNTTNAFVLKKGMRVGSFVIREISEQRLSLRGSRRFAMGRLIVEILLLALGLAAWGAVLRDDPAKPRNLKVLLFPLAGAVLAATGLLHFGEEWAFDGQARTFFRRGFFGEATMGPGKISCLQLTVLPTNLQQREAVVLKLLARDVLAIGRARSKKPAAMNLIAAAKAIAIRLQIPVTVEGEMNEAPASAAQALEELRAAGSTFRRAA